MINEVIKRACSICKEEKPLDSFCVNKKNKLGRDCRCRDCTKIYSKNYYNKNKERLAKERNKNKEEKIKYSKEYYRKNRDILIQKQTKRYLEDKDNILLKSKERASKDDSKKKRNDKRKKRIKDDECFRIRFNLKNRIYYALKGVAKSKKTLELLGCTLEFFKKYLEEKFLHGMNWENYGKNGWHIDHIIPCAAFDLTKKEQQEICFHYTNMQPLWALDNIKKGKKIIT